MRTWELPVTPNLIISIRSQTKVEAKALVKKIDRIIHISAYRRELRGVYGESEDESLMMTIGGSNKIENLEKYMRDLKEFLAGLPPVITDLVDIARKADALFNEHVPVVNTRKTRKQAETEDDEYRKTCAELEARDKAERTAFLEEWGRQEKVAIPAGTVAVHLGITYDGSDPLSDYHRPYMQIGHDLLLGLVPEGAQTQRCARDILGQYPELLKYAYTWHSERYSHGGGNFLVGEWTGRKMKRYARDRKDPVDTRFVVRFSRISKEMYPYKNYRASVLPPSIPAAGQLPVMTLNAAKNGVEIRFPGGSGPEGVAGQLRGAGFRPNRWRQFWYAKQTPDSIAFAEQLCGIGGTFDKPQCPGVSPSAPAADTACPQTEGDVAPTPASQQPGAAQVADFQLISDRGTGGQAVAPGIEAVAQLPAFEYEQTSLFG